MGGKGDNFDHFGDSAAIDDDVVAVGATSDDDAANSAGAVYIYERDGGGANQWGQVAKLTASDGGANQSFGFAIDISGDRMVVGALFETNVAENFGAAYVFEKERGQWVQKAKLEPINPDPEDNFGITVAISGETAVVGADAGDEQGGVANLAPGTAYVFEPGGGRWRQTARLSVNEESDFFGAAVSLSGDFLAIGAPGHNEDGANSSGAVYIFDRDTGGQWRQAAKVIPCDIEERVLFGNGMALSGNALVAGAPASEVNKFVAAGAAYVFERKENGQWTQVAKLHLENPGRQQAFGTRVAISGDKVVSRMTDFLEFGTTSDRAIGGGVSIFRVPVSPPPPPPSEYEDIFGGDPDQGEGWHESTWFGFYNVNFDPWIFHLQHGWTFLEASSTPDSMFLFDLTTGGWYFTGQRLYPNLFSFGRNAWVFYVVQTSNPRQYVDLGTEEFLELE